MVEQKSKTTISLSPDLAGVLSDLVERSRKASDLPITQSAVIEGLLKFAQARKEEAIAWIIAHTLEKKKNSLTRGKTTFTCIPLRLHKFTELSENNDKQTHKYGPLIEGWVVSIGGNLWLMYATIPVTSKDFYVDVWNSQGTLFVWDESKQKYVPAEEIFNTSSEECFQLINDIVEAVVVEENDMALNISGRYYPLDKKSVELFEKLKEKCTGT